MADGSTVSFDVAIDKDTLAFLVRNITEYSQAELSLVDCCVCLETKTTLIHISCGHDVCDECVKSMLTKNMDFRCPLCRQTTLLQTTTLPRSLCECKPGLSDKILIDADTAAGQTNRCKFSMRQSTSDTTVLTADVSCSFFIDFMENLEEMGAWIHHRSAQDTYLALQSIIMDERLFISLWVYKKTTNCEMPNRLACIFTSCPCSVYAMHWMMDASEWLNADIVGDIKSIGFEDIQIELLPRGIIWQMRYKKKIVTVESQTPEILLEQLVRVRDLCCNHVGIWATLGCDTTCTLGSRLDAS